MMNDTTSSKVLVTISVPPTLEERVIDWLLERKSGPGFTTYDIRGHSSKHDHLSVAEQVSGRQRRKRFEIELDEILLEQFVGRLAESFSGSDLHYFVTPIFASCKLDAIRPPDSYSGETG